MTTRATAATVGQSATSESDSAYIPGPTEPLMPQQEKMPKIIDDKEVDGAVYKSTIDQVQIKQAPKYIGLSKEELEYYANDPAWKKIRWVCLLLFWLAWIVMFLAAILIVVSSPKCPPKPHREWFQTKLCYQIWTRSFQDSDNDGIGDLNGLTNRVKELAQNKISAIWPIPLLDSNSSSGYDVKDHRKIDPQLGTSEDFDKLVAEVKKNDIKFIMDLPLTTVSVTHPWFEKSQNREGQYLDYFVWKSVAPADQKPWAQDSVRSEYYYHWGRNARYPILNWEHKPVRDEMKSIIKYWIDRKVDGFYLGHIEYMSINEDGTPNWDNIHNYLNDLHEFAQNLTTEKLLTFTSLDFGKTSLKDLSTELKLNLKLKGQVDYVINNELVTVNESCGARCLHQHLDKVNKFHEENNATWPMWEIGHPYVSRLATRMVSVEKAELMQMLLMSLPGSINTYYGDELGMVDSPNPPKNKKSMAPRAPMQWSADANAGFSGAPESSLYFPINADYKEKNYEAQNSNGRTTMKMWRRLAGLRGSEEAFLYGNMTLGPIDDNILLIFANSKTGSASFLTVLNFGQDPADKINLRMGPFAQLPLNGFDITSVVTTKNLGQREIYWERKAVDVKMLDLKANEGIVLRLKPTK